MPETVIKISQGYDDDFIGAAICEVNRALAERGLSFRRCNEGRGEFLEYKLVEAPSVGQAQERSWREVTMSEAINFAGADVCQNHSIEAPESGAEVVAMSYFDEVNAVACKSVVEVRNPGPETEVAVGPSRWFVFE